MIILIISGYVPEMVQFVDIKPRVDYFVKVVLPVHVKVLAGELFSSWPLNEILWIVKMHSYFAHEVGHLQRRPLDRHKEGEQSQRFRVEAPSPPEVHQVDAVHSHAERVQAIRCDTVVEGEKDALP